MGKIDVRYSKVMVVCNDNTYKAAGSGVIAQFKDREFDVDECVLERGGMLVPMNGFRRNPHKMEKDVMPFRL